MDKKQTAVEWLIESLPQIDWEHPHYGQLVQHAKQIEKEQILDAYYRGGEDTPLTDKECEEYYHKTY